MRLGVIAIGVGEALEAETVMLRSSSMMRLPDIVGVKLTGQRQEDNSGYCRLLSFFAMREWSQTVWNSSVKGSCAAIGDRATISNMTPEYGATAGMFYIDEQTIQYLKLTGREPEQG